MILEFLFVPYDLYSYFLAVGMIKASQRLSKTAGAESLQHFESVADVILEHSLIISIIIIVAVIVDIHLLQSFHLSHTWYHRLPVVVACGTGL